MIQNSLLSSSVLHRRKEPDLFPRVVLADARVPGQAVANEVFVVGRGKVWSLLIDAIEAANESIVRERDARGVDRKRIVLRSYKQGSLSKAKLSGLWLVLEMTTFPVA